jgi:hypothetical protein
MENATIFFDWTNILMEPFGVTFSSGRGGAPTAEYPRFLRFEKPRFRWACDSASSTQGRAV